MSTLATCLLLLPTFAGILFVLREDSERLLSLSEREPLSRRALRAFLGPPVGVLSVLAGFLFIAPTLFLGAAAFFLEFLSAELRESSVAGKHVKRIPRALPLQSILGRLF